MNKTTLGTVHLAETYRLPPEYKVPVTNVERNKARFHCNKHCHGKGTMVEAQLSAKVMTPKAAFFSSRPSSILAIWCTYSRLTASFHLRL
uniref:Uncharacterized protein n=1 Tax=Hyaloperonospora arabidopsidis (strain Emoy2) TaxID=559515 RepID=M4B1P9_HYAAE